MVDTAELRLLICDERPVKPLTAVCSALMLLMSEVRSLVTVVRAVVIELTEVESVLMELCSPVTAVCRLPVAVVIELWIEPSVVLSPETAVETAVTFVPSEWRVDCRVARPIETVPRVVEIVPTVVESEPIALERLETCVEVAIQLLTVNDPELDALKPDVLLLTVAPTTYAPSPVGTVKLNE